MSLLFKQRAFWTIAHQIEMHTLKFLTRNLKCRKEFRDSLAVIHSTDSDNGRPCKRSCLNIHDLRLSWAAKRTIQNHADFLRRNSPIRHSFGDRLANDDYPLCQAHDYGVTVMHIVDMGNQREAMDSRQEPCKEKSGAHVGVNHIRFEVLNLSPEQY